MALNPQFPNYANGAAGTEVIGYTVVGGQPLYRLPVAFFDTGFGAALVCEGSTLEAPTYPEGVYDPDPNITDPGQILGSPAVGQLLVHTAATVTGTAPITVGTAWIRYKPGGQQEIVGNANTYTLLPGDLGYSFFVQTVAVNSEGAVATQTLPIGPITGTAPVITNAGTITSVPPNGGGSSSGAIASVTLTNPGQDYIYILGAPDVSVGGDGNGAIVTATLAEEGRVVALGTNPTTGTPNTTGTYTYTGENGETPIVLTWTADGAGDVTYAITNPGAGWTQANVVGCETLSYGTFVITNSSDILSGGELSSYIGVPLAGLTLSNGGTGYTVAPITITPVAGDTFGNGATATANLGSANIIYPTQLAVYSGPTVSGNPQVSWVWGYGQGVDFTPVQLGGLEYRVPVSAVGQEIFVRVTATDISGTTVAYSTGIEVEGTAPVAIRDPKIGPFEVTIGDILTGQQGTWAGYPQPQVTDWGFALFALPTPTPIPEANKVYTYKIPQGAEGNRYVFYVTAENSSGSDTAYSLPTDAVYDTLSVVEVPRISYIDDLPTIGTVLRGTPAIFFPSEALQYSYFAYLNTDGTITEIAGTQGTTSYTCLLADVGKKIVYASYGEIPGLYGPQTLTSFSNSAGPIRQFAKILTPGSITFAGAAPQIGEVCTATWGTIDPAIGSQAGGPTVTEISVYYREEAPIGDVYQYNFIANKVNPTGPLSFTVPVKAYKWSLVVSYTVTFNDAGGTGPTQTLLSEYQSPTPAVDGTQPAVITPAGFDPANVYNPGYELTWNPGTFSGNPTPTVTWAWYRNLTVTDKELLQNGGLTYTLPDDSSNWNISVEEYVTNVVGGIYYDYNQQIGGPLPVWTRQPSVTGSGLMTPTQGTSLTGISPLAKDPSTEQNIPVDWNWYYQYPGQDAVVLPGERTPIEVFLNENGKWTGVQIFIRGTATNPAGTVTIESNRVTLQGTPRIIAQGQLIGSNQIGNKNFGIIPVQADGGSQAVTNTWEVGAVAQSWQHAFTSPATSYTLLALETGTATISLLSYNLSNAQGATSVQMDPIQRTYV